MSEAEVYVKVGVQVGLPSGLKVELHYEAKDAALGSAMLVLSKISVGESLTRDDALRLRYLLVASPPSLGYEWGAAVHVEEEEDVVA